MELFGSSGAVKFGKGDVVRSLLERSRFVEQKDWGCNCLYSERFMSPFASWIFRCFRNELGCV